VFKEFARKCLGSLLTGPVVFGADLNFDFGQIANTNNEQFKLRKKIWEEVWSGALANGKGVLTPISKHDAATHFPPNKGAGACLDMIFLLTSTKHPATAYPSMSSIIQTQIAHQITTAHFSINKAPIHPAPKEAPAKEGVKWSIIRYDNEKQDGFRARLQADLLNLTATKTFTPTTITDMIIEVGRKVLGTFKNRVRRDDAPQATSRGKGTTARRKQPWWNTELDQKARKITVCRRKIDACVTKLQRKSRGNDTPIREPTTQRSVLMSHRRDLKGLIIRFKTLCNKTRSQYYDKVAATKEMRNYEHVSTAHRIRKNILTIRSGKPNAVQHDAAVMNKAWSAVFRGNTSRIVANAEFLDDTLHRVKVASVNDALIVITKEHVKDAKKGLALNKAPGIDGIANEALRLITDDVLLDAFAKMFSEMINDPTKIATEWKRGLVALIPKKDNPCPLDYRPIALLSHLAKFMELTVKAYLDVELNAEARLGAYQMGFRRGRGTEEASLTLMAIDEICRQQKRPLVGIFLDIKKAYDSVPAKVLAASLRRRKIPPRLINFLFEWVSGHKRKLLVPDNEGEDAWLELNVGVPQGSILAPFLFACVMDTLHAYLKGRAVLGLGRSDASHAVTIQPMLNTWREIMYADDTTIFNHNITQSNITLAKVAKWSSASGMTFHPEKFECLRLGAIDAKQSPLFAPNDEAGRRVSIATYTKFNGTKLPVVKGAKHLGLFKSFAGSTNPTFTIDLTKRLKKAGDSSDALTFAYKVGKNAATVHFASNLHRSVAEGAAYFGCALCDHSDAQIQAITTTIGKAAKAGLGIHQSAPTDLALSYLGWQKPVTVIAMRRLSLLRRALGGGPPEIRALTRTMIESNDECFPSPYLKLLNKSVETVVSDEVRTKHWPQSRETWMQRLNDDSAVETMYSELCKGIAFNCQHPMIRASPRHAATAFRFICPTLKPWERTGNDTELCQICHQGRNSGYHLLNECQDDRIRATTNGLLPASLRSAWINGRENRNFDELNEVFLDHYPRLRSESAKVKDLVLIKPTGNDIDILARILRHRISMMEQEEGEAKLREFLRKKKIVWQDLTTKTSPSSPLLQYKSRLYTAYNWIGCIIDEIWTEYCLRDKRARVLREEAIEPH
jgi:hypothetical protein